MKTVRSNGISCFPGSKGLISSTTSLNGGRKNGSIALREVVTKQDLCLASIHWVNSDFSELFKDIREESESIQSCNVMYTYHTDGRVTFLTVGQHSIAHLLPMLVRSLEELVVVEDGKHASSRQWIPCTCPEKFHRMKLMNQGWYHTKQI